MNRAGHPFLRTRLSVHMFLTFAILGAWQTVLAQYLQDLGLTGKEVSLVLGCGALAAMLSPLVAGRIADRWLATERFLALSNLCCGGFLLAASRATTFGALWWLSIGAALFYVISIPLGTAMSMVHLPDSRDFPWVRLWGTVGWVAAGGFLWVWQSLTGRGIGDCYGVAGAIALLNGAYSITLPHTPPQPAGRRRGAAPGALALLKDPSLALFLGLLFCLQVSAAFYYARGAIFYHAAGVSKQALSVVMSIPQAAEIGAMLLLPAVYARFGAKWTVAAGIAAWAVRFGIYSLGHPLGLLVGAQVLHAAGFAFVRIAASVYVENVTPRELRATSQSLLSCLIDGAGAFLGVYVAGAVSDALFRESARWAAYWVIPAAASLAVLLAFLLGFRPRAAGGTASPPGTAPAPGAAP